MGFKKRPTDGEDKGSSVAAFVIWAIICLGILVGRMRTIWRLTSGSWLAITAIYAGLLLGVPLLGKCFNWIDAIHSRGLKFFVQIIISLVIASALCLLLAFATL